MLHNMGEWQSLVSKPIHSRKPTEKPNHPQSDQNQSQFPEFLLPFKVTSSRNHMWPPSGHPGTSAFLPATGRPQTPSPNPHVGLAPPSALQLPKSKGPANSPASMFARWVKTASITSTEIILVLGVEGARCFFRNAQLTSPTSVNSRRVHSPQPPSILSIPQARLTGFFDPIPPPATILTSMVHVPASPWSHPNSDTRKG